MSFIDGKPQTVSEIDLKADWGGRSHKKFPFRCYMCGHKFQLGEYWRFIFTNDIAGAGGNPIVCHSCDGDDVRERWKKLCDEFNGDKFWWFKACLGDWDV